MHLINAVSCRQFGDNLVKRHPEVDARRFHLPQPLGVHWCYAQGNDCPCLCSVKTGAASTFPRAASCAFAFVAHIVKML